MCTIGTSGERVVNGDREILNVAYAIRGGWIALGALALASLSGCATEDCPPGGSGSIFCLETGEPDAGDPCVPDIACDTGNPCELGLTQCDASGASICLRAGFAPADTPCGDGLACDGMGGCTFPINIGTCVIDATCYDDQDTNPSNVCEICEADLDQTMWFPNNGAMCDDGDPGTTNDICFDTMCMGS